MPLKERPSRSLLSGGSIRARRARRAVVFRRGPSKQVLLLSWDTDFPIYHLRLTRDGWRRLPGEAEKKHPLGSTLFYSFDPAITYRRVRPKHRAADLELQMRITGFYEREGPPAVAKW
jgi:hypothetical protein